MPCTWRGGQVAARACCVVSSWQTIASRRLSEAIHSRLRIVHTRARVAQNKPSADAPPSMHTVVPFRSSSSPKRNIP